MPSQPTTVPGYVNRNEQEVIGATGFASTTHYNQKIYKLHCRRCGEEYGCNGADIHIRRCPKVECLSNAGKKPGARGELLRQASPTLFEKM